MQIQQRELRRSQNQLDMERLQKGFDIGLVTTSNEIDNAQSQLDQAIENYALSEKIYSRENILYTEGLGSSFALISAQQDMIEAEIDILEKTYQLAIAKFNWKQKKRYFMRTYVVYPIVLCLIGFVGCGQDKGSRQKSGGHITKRSGFRCL